MTDISGKLVVITGAASGIGRATAILAASEGARVLTDLNPLDETDAAIRGEGGFVALARSLDVSDYDAVMAFAREAHPLHGPVDVVMNIAGISIWGTVSGLEHQHWRSLVEVNLMGPIHVIEAFVPAMVDAGRGGHLVNVSSAAGLIGRPWGPGTVPQPRGLAGGRGPVHPSGRPTRQVPRLHLGRHLAGLHRTAALPTRVRRRDAPAQLGRRPGAARGREGEGGPMTPRISPGSLREVGALIGGFGTLAGLVTGTEDPQAFLVRGRTRRLFWALLLLAGGLMPGGKLPRRETALVILRVTTLAGSDYEWSHHERLSRRVGLTGADLATVCREPSDPHWTGRDRVLLTAVDELHEKRDLGDDTWAQLRAGLDERLCVEFVLLAGLYQMLATTLDALRVEPDPQRKRSRP